MSNGDDHLEKMTYAELMADREIVLAAVKQDGRAFYHTTPELQADREIVLAAVMQVGMALGHAASGLMADREIVLAAVMQDGSALGYASAELTAELKADVLVQFATAQSVREFDRCMKIMRKKYRDDIDGKWTETAIDVMGRCANINDKPTVLKQVETFVKRASHPTNGLLGKRGRKDYAKEFV